MSIREDQLMEALYGQHGIDYIHDTNTHVGKWVRIDIVAEAVFNELLQNGAMVNNLELADVAAVVAATSAFALGTLTLTGVAKDAEHCTIGSDVFEFAADAALGVTAGRHVVDINAHTTKSQGTLTLPTKPTANDAFVVGDVTYTYKAAAAAAGDVAIGADVAASQVNAVAAINGTDGLNTPNAKARAAAFAANASVITALIGGVAGDLIATTETFTAEDNVFDAATLGTTTAGVDCTAANAITALVAAYNALTTRDFVASDGSGDTFVVTAIVPGTKYNGVATTEGMANASWGGAVTASGTNAAVAINKTLYGDFTSIDLTSGRVAAYRA